MRPQPGAGFEWVDTAGGPALRCRALVPFAEHLFTTRSWSIGSADGLDDPGRDGWGDVARAMHVDPSRLRRVRQVHGRAVSVVRRNAPAPSRLDEADILVSNDPTIALAVQTADCVAMLIVDARRRAVAAAHAGWRGLAARVPYATVAAMAESFGSRPADLIVAMGPSISAERYEVGGDVRERFENAGFTADRLCAWFPGETRREHWLFDGWQSARDQIEATGVPRASIHVAELCTAAHADLFCSYRRDGKRAGRMAAAITLRAAPR